jgi:hypothetical protein
VPPDSGEAADPHPAGIETLVPVGRQVDLTKPAGTEIAPADGLIPERRVRVADWAWQHVRGDVDTYEISFPQESPAPSLPKSGTRCRYDRPSSLVLLAPGMHLKLLEGPGDEADHDLGFSHLATALPSDRVLHVEVTNPAPERGLYRLRVEWTNARYSNGAECSLFAPLPTPIFPGPLSDLIHNSPGPSDPPGEGWLPVYPLGGFQRVRIEGDRLSDVISASAELPVTVRMFDPATGVMLADSTPLTSDDAMTARIPTASCRAQRSP